MRKTIGVGMTWGISLLALQMGIDMAAIQKWNNAKVIRYHVVGVHDARVSLASYAKADVLDRITLDFDWDAKARKPIGEIKFVNEKSQLKNPGADGTKCGPPAIKGSYEHFEVSSAIAQHGGTIELKGTQSIPAVDDPQWPTSCSPRTTTAKVVEGSVFLGLAEPQLLALPSNMGQKGLTIAADKKSYALTAAGNWIWTVTPTIVQ